jgi:ribosomal protein S2
MVDEKIRRIFLVCKNKMQFTGVILYISKVKWSHHKQKYVFKYPEKTSIIKLTKKENLMLLRDDGTNVFYSMRRKDWSYFSTTKDDMVENYKKTFKKNWNRLAKEEQEKIELFLKGLKNEEI